MSKKVKIAIISLVVILVALVVTPKILGTTSGAKAVFVVLDMNMWIKLQALYHSQNKSVGSDNEIGYEGRASSDFSFYSDFVSGKATHCAENKNDLGECKAGNKWCASMTDDGSLKLIEPDKACMALTPDFLNLPTK